MGNTTKDHRYLNATQPRAQQVVKALEGLNVNDAKEVLEEAGRILTVVSEVPSSADLSEIFRESVSPEAHRKAIESLREANRLAMRNGTFETLP